MQAGIFASTDRAKVQAIRAATKHINTVEPTVTPELIGILAVGATVIGLLLTFRRDARGDNQALRAEFRSDNQALRADNQALRAEFRADNQRLRAEVRADSAQVRGDLADLRNDVQALTERMSRVEGVIEGLFAGRDRHNDAA